MRFAGLALAAWTLAVGFGMLWWHYLKSGEIYSHGGRSSRKHNPFNYWFALVLLGAVVVGMAAGASLFTAYGVGHVRAF